MNTLDRPIPVVLSTAPSLRSRQLNNLERTLQGAAPARPKGGDLVQHYEAGYLSSSDWSLGFVSELCLSLLTY
jgi:hypothetical protein